MMLSLTKDNNEIILRKYINIFAEAWWTMKIVWVLKVKSEKKRNQFQGGLKTNTDSSNVRMQDIGRDKMTAGPEEGLTQLSSCNSFIYDLIRERRGVFSA